MKKPTKAALLSALVFPGLGHLYLKKHISGLVLIGISTGAVYYLISKTIERTLQIVEKIQSGNVPLDLTAIMELVSQQSTGTEAQLLNIATLVVIICWFIGIVDSYRVACIQDKNK